MSKKTGRQRGNGQGSISFDESKCAFIARLTVGYTESGSRKVVKRQAKTKTEAEALLRQLHEKHRTGNLAPDSKQTLGAWLDHWRASLPSTLAPRTLESYELTARLHLKPALGGRPISAVKPSEVEALYRKMRIDKKLTRSVEIAHRILCASYKEAVRLGVIGSSPMEKVRPPKTSAGKVEAFHTPDQTHAVIEKAREANDPALLAFVLVGIETGARLAELSGLSWEDVETVDGGCLVTFRMQLAREGQHWILKRLKTDKSLRAAFLSEEATEALAGQRLRQSLEQTANPLKLALLNEIARPWEHSHLNSRLAWLCKKAEVPYMSSHKMFRHTYATRTLKAGATLHDVSRVLGHSTPNLTGALYGHHTLEASKRVADIGQRALKEASDRSKKRKDPGTIQPLHLDDV